MSNYTATIRWSRDPSTDFAQGQYSRAHSFVIASAAKQSSVSRANSGLPRRLRLLAMTGEGR
jgi:hypothetical protein